MLAHQKYLYSLYSYVTQENYDCYAFVIGMYNRLCYLIFVAKSQFMNDNSHELRYNNHHFTSIIGIRYLCL